MVIKRALCIGINAYGGDASLHQCVHDAEAWARHLAGLGYYVTTLLDQAATGNGIRAAVTTLMDLTTRGDRSVITYSGHGTYVPDDTGDEPDGVDEAWCGQDILISRRGIVLDDELAVLLQARESGARVTVISDSCHSGTMTRQFAPLAPTQAGRRIRFLHPGAFLPDQDLAALRTGRALRHVSATYPAVLLAACQDHEYSYEDARGGVFTEVALRTFTAGMSYAAWMRAIHQQLPTRDYPQSPRLDAGCWQGYWKALQ